MCLGGAHCLAQAHGTFGSRVWETIWDDRLVHALGLEDVAEQLVRIRFGELARRGSGESHSPQQTREWAREPENTRVNNNNN